MISIRLFLCFYALVLPIAAKRIHIATSTSLAQHALLRSGIPPAPTQKPFVHEILKRQNHTGLPLPSSACGYLNSNVSQPLVCSAGSYCGLDSNIGNFGCCSSYSLTSDTFHSQPYYALVNCSYFGTTCFDATSTAGYNSSNPLQGVCSATTYNDGTVYPYCNTYVSSSANASIIYCGTTPAVFLLSNSIAPSDFPTIPFNEVQTWEVTALLSSNVSTTTSSSSTSSSASSSSTSASSASLPSPPNQGTASSAATASQSATASASSSDAHAVQAITFAAVFMTSSAFIGCLFWSLA